MALPPQSANVRSIEAIQHFRSSLAVYATKAKPLVEDAWDEVSRVREWIRTDRRVHWENQVRRRRQKLDEAEQALFSARFSSLKQVTAAEQLAVQRARRALAEAESKLDHVKRWSQEFDDRAGSMLKQLEEVRSNITTQLPKALALLNQITKSLEHYMEATPPPEESASSGEPKEVPPAEANVAIRHTKEAS